MTQERLDALIKCIEGEQGLDDEDKSWVIKCCQLIKYLEDGRHQEFMEMFYGLPSEGFSRSS